MVFITSGALDKKEECWSENTKVVYTRFLSVYQQKQLGVLIEGYSPSQIWWSTTPRTVAFWPVLAKINCPIISLITCPLYTWRELIRASLAGVPIAELRALWLQRLVPRWLFVWMLYGRIFCKIFTQSKANREILISYGTLDKKVTVLPVGIDNEDRLPVNDLILTNAKLLIGSKIGDFTFLYFGAVRSIRGFHALMKAFPHVVRSDSKSRLVVLARGADKELCLKIEQRADGLGLRNKIRIVGGWLTREQIWGCIEACDVVVLPFVIVPSDIPIAILEALSRGKPVVASPIDGIPELVTGRGVIVDPLDTVKFAEVMIQLAGDGKEVIRLGQLAQVYMKKYPDWNEVGEIALQEVN